MIIVDTALACRAREGKPINVGLIGAGFSGTQIAYELLTGHPGIRLAAIANRTVAKAEAAYLAGGATHVRVATSADAVSDAVARREYVVSAAAEHVCDAEGVDAIIEATGTVEYGARTVCRAVQSRKHVVLMNVELDATVGPILKARAEAAGVIYTNTDGDEPGVAMNTFRFVRSIGLAPVVAGNLKGLYDRYRNPDTQLDFARQHGQRAATMAHFADGTKLSMELTVLANATRFGVACRGMHGPRLEHVNDSAAFYAERLIEGGMVDFLVGAAPGNGAFVVGYTGDRTKRNYLKYLKMGDGPLYVFYTPFHLPHLEIPLTVGRAVLLGDATVAPAGAPTCDTVAVAKRDLAPGDVLDGFGGFLNYGLIESYRTSRTQDLLPIGVAKDCRLVREVEKDCALTYDDVELPPGRLCDQLRREQNEYFRAGAGLAIS